MAEGFEEIEFVTVVDILRRAEMEVVATSLGKRTGDGEEKEIGPVEGSHGIKIVPNTTLDDIDPEEFDAVVLHGVLPGFLNLGEDNQVYRSRPPYHRLAGVLGILARG